MLIFFKLLTQITIVFLGSLVAVVAISRMLSSTHWGHDSNWLMWLSELSNSLSYFMIPVVALATLISSSIYEFLKGFETKQIFEFTLSFSLVFAAILLFLNYNSDTVNILEEVLGSISLVYFSAIFSWMMLFVEVLNFFSQHDFEKVES